MPEQVSPWGLAADVCDRLLDELNAATKTVFEAAVENQMPVGEAASLMFCLAKIEAGIKDAESSIGEWIGGRQSEDR